MSGVRVVAWGLSLLAAIAPRASTASDAHEAASGLYRVTPPSGPAVYLRPLELELGSTEEEVLSALVRCKREPLGERCDETTFTTETPTRRERLAGFWMSRTEVTVAEYGRCVARGRCRAPAFDAGAARFQRPSFPVTLVSFDDAKRYCSFRGGRLPTESEFERAARGAPRRLYPWGRTFHSRLANHGRLGVDATDASDGYSELAPVGSYPDGATPEGLLDLAGNVAEWTSDAFSPVHGAPPTAERAVRGGHYEDAAPFLRAAARSGRAPETREPTLGFRCVWQLKPMAD